MDKSKKTISFVFPVYNEEHTLPELFARLNKVLDKLRTKYEVEVIFVNDGSTDESLNILLQLANKNSSNSIINFSRNFGHQMAITAGMDHASGDAVIIMDADLQDPPEVSLDLVEKWKEGYDVVYAKRKTRKDNSFKKATAKFYYRILNHLSDIEIPLDTGDFRLLDRKVVDEMKKFRERNRFMRGLAAYMGFKQTEVLFDRDKRFAGKTNYSLGKMLTLAVNGFTSFSTVPLRLIAQFGLLVSLFSFAGIIYAVALRIFYPEITVSGWTTLILAVLFIGGVQMIMLGVIGMYIGRIYTEVQHRPLYIIDSVYNKK